MNSQSASGTSHQRSQFLIQYVVTAYIVSWAIEIPLALRAQGIVSWDIPFAVHYLAAFGPLIGGIALTWRESKSEGLRELLGRTFRWRVSPIWWLVALSPLLLFFVSSAIMRVFQGSWISIGILGRFDFLPDLGLWVVLIWLATYGIGEELGWRGYLLPRLQRDRSAWSATFMLWVIWATWHAPSFFYLHTASSGSLLIGFLVGVLAGAIFLTWLYNSCGGSILIVAVWHGLFDYVTACTECKSGLVAALVSTLVMVWAVVVVVLYKPENLSTRPRHTL